MRFSAHIAGTVAVGLAAMVTLTAQRAPAHPAFATTVVPVTIPLPPPPTTVPVATKAAAKATVRRPVVVARPTVTTVAAHPARTDQLLFDGQSFNAAPFLGHTYPIQLIELMPGRIATNTMVAIAGTAYWQRFRTVATRVDALIPKATRTTVLDLGGQSDLEADLTGQQLYDAASSYADGRRKAGAAFFLEFTVPPSTKYTPAEDANRLQYNALLRADHGRHFSAIIDIASAPELANPRDLRYFDSDGMHPTEAADTVFATMALAALNPLL